VFACRTLVVKRIAAHTKAKSWTSTTITQKRATKQWNSELFHILALRIPLNQLFPATMESLCKVSLGNWGSNNNKFGESSGWLEETKTNQL